MSGGRRSKLETPPKTITCWRCRRKIGLDAARRSCPLCGAEPSVARYDERVPRSGAKRPSCEPMRKPFTKAARYRMQ